MVYVIIIVIADQPPATGSRKSGRLQGKAAPAAAAGAAPKPGPSGRGSGPVTRG